MSRLSSRFDGVLCWSVANRSIASFKLREGLPIGCKVTLRGERMYEFLDRLITVAIPRIRDFRGVSARAFDGRGARTNARGARSARGGARRLPCGAAYAGGEG